MAVNITWTDVPEAFDLPQNTAQLHLQPSLPAPDYLTSHAFIEGDNYPVLQKLLPAYKNSVNLIYIDPPYNTGNTFTYNDSFGEKGDYHSQWLSFMARRLKLAQKILTESGCIFIAIDQAELYALKLLCDGIFGEENFVNDFMWLHGKGKKDSWSRTLQQHTLCYAKNKKQLLPFKEIEFTDWAKTNADNDPRGNWFSGSISFSEKRSNPNHKNYYAIKSPSGIEWKRQWMCTKQEMEKLLSENKIYFGPAPEYKKVPRKKIFNEEPEEIIPKNIIDCAASTRKAAKHVDSLLNEKGVFDNPKPVDLICHLIKITRQPQNAIIMDFFAGSGTTFEAVCQLNQEDCGSRKCILIQKAENPKKQITFNTISDLCWERIKKNCSQFKTDCNKYILQ